MPRLIDTHTHLQFPAYDEDREAVIRRALEAGIWMVNVGTDVASSKAAIELAKHYPEGVYASVGFHPGHLAGEFHDEWEKKEPGKETFDITELSRLAEDPSVIAIGECGLDYYRIQDSAVRIQQEEIFRSQIHLAHEAGKPMIIHCREAFPDLIRILNSESLLLNSHRAGIIHFFSGTAVEADQLIAMGFYLGFGGVVTFAKGYREVVEHVALDRIVLETDAPYVAPVPYRGKRNEPLYMEATAAKIAEWKNASIDEVARVTTENAQRLLHI